MRINSNATEAVRERNRDGERKGERKIDRDIGTTYRDQLSLFTGIQMDVKSIQKVFLNK